MVVWSQVILSSVGTALVTAAALLLQQWRTDKRADRVRAEERRDRQLGELRAAHVEMLSALAEIWHPLDPLFRELPSPRDAPAEFAPGTTLAAPQRARVDAAHSLLHFVASDEAIEAADKAVAALFTCYSLISHCLHPDLFEGPTVRQVLQHRAGAREAEAGYASLARKDVEAMRLDHVPPPARTRR